MMRQLAEGVMVSSQLAPADIAALAQEGVTVLVNNRPDGEEPDQPPASDIEEAARAAGIDYHFVPIVRGIGPADVAAMKEALKQAQGAKLMAFCRSGTRSALALALAKRHSGTPGDEVQRLLVEAGFDPGPIAHLL